MDEEEHPNQENTRDFHLAPKQRTRIGDDDAFSNVSAPGKYLKNIRKNKVEKLPERIERLFTDIRILAGADFFTEGWEAEIWERVDLSDDWSSWDWESNLEELLYGQDHDFEPREPPIGNTDEKDSSQTTGPINFGIELGHSLRLLSNSYLSEDERLDLLVGIFVGVMQQDPMQRYPSAKNTIDEPIELADTFNQKLKAWVLMDNLSRQSAGSLQWNIKTRDKIIADCIDSAGLTRSSSLVDYLLDEVDFSPVEEEQTNEERKQEIRKVEQHLEDLIENTEIARIDQLIQAVTKSKALLADMDANAENILVEIYLSEGAQYHEIDYDGKNLRVITSLLAGEHEHSDGGKYQEWTQRPLIQRISKDWEHTKWKTTKFGTLVGYITDADKDPGFLYDYAIGENEPTADESDMIEQALSELEL
jgi:hypothetical protein